MAQLDDLFKSFGDPMERRNHWHHIEQTHATTGGASAIDSIPGRMFDSLYENIRTELLNQRTPPDISMRDTLMLIVKRYSKTRQRQAGLETLS